MSIFLGVELSIPVADRLLVLQEDLVDPLRHLFVDARWTPAEQFRITLKDFGELNDGQLARLRELLSAYAKATHPFTVDTVGAYLYPSAQCPRMILTDSTDPSGILTALRTNVEKAAGPLGFVPDESPWKATTLVGRLKTPDQPADLRGVLEAHAETHLGTTRVRELVLMKITRVGTRARSRVLQRYELGTGL